MPIHCLLHTNTYQDIDIIYIKHRWNISKSLKIRLLTNSICRYLFHFIGFNIIAFFFFSFSFISLVNNPLKTLSLRSSDKYYFPWENAIQINSKLRPCAQKNRMKREKAPSNLLNLAKCSCNNLALLFWLSEE